MRGLVEFSGYKLQDSGYEIVMAIFEYKAKTSSGSTVSGGVEAQSEEKAIQTLEDRGLILLSITQRDKAWVFQLNVFSRIKPKNVVVFFRQLSVLVSATIPIVQSLRVLLKQTTDHQLQNIVSEIADDVEGGARLSQACERHPKVFSDFYVNMIRSGETSGHLDEVLNYLADQRERDYDLMSKVKGAMIYPAFIVSALILVGILVMAFVIPKLTTVLTEAGGELPVTTKALIATSNFFSHYWWAILIGLLFVPVGFKAIAKTPSGKKTVDTLLIKLPIFGPLFQKIYLIRLTRSLSTLVKGGVPLPKALSLTADIVGNTVYKSLVEETVKEVEDGNPIASVFLRSTDIPPMLSNMLSVGEQTGRIDVILEKITAFYARELENAVGNLVSLIEPLIILIMGVAVGLMVAAVIMPIYNLASNF